MIVVKIIEMSQKNISNSISLKCKMTQKEIFN